MGIDYKNNGWKFWEILEGTIGKSKTILGLGLAYD